MYVDAATACNDLSFALGDTASGTNLVSRSWSVRVTQFDCGSENLAPSGCVQYLYGDNSGTIQSFNYQGTYHLADQRQKICFRREKGNCRMCYSHVSSIADIQVSGGTANKQESETCCQYKGADGKGTKYDCLLIPGLSTTKGKALNFKGEPNGVCGGGALATKATVVDTTKQKTLCSKNSNIR